MINNKKQYKIALLGSQIKYSLSSKIHNAAFYYLKMNWYYECIEIKCYNNFNWPKFFVKLMKLGFIGANVTAPFKQSLLPYLHKLSNIVLCIKATNTLKFNDSYCFGYNTDAFGFAQDLYKNNNYH